MLRRIGFLYLFLFSSAGLIAGTGVPAGPADTSVVLPPAWAFGVLYGGYTNQEETISRIREIQAHGYPIDAYWIDSWFWSYADRGRGPAGYLNFKGDSAGYPDRKAMWSFMEQNRIKGGFWVWDCIFETGNEPDFSEFKNRGFFSSVYRETNPWHNAGTTTDMFARSADPAAKGTWCGNINFSDSSAVSLFREKLTPFFREGADFIKLDRTARPEVCRAVFDLTAEAGKESRGRGFILSHSFDTESGEYKKFPAKWTDDTRSDWTVEQPTLEFDPWIPRVGLKENIAMFTDPASATSRIPFLTQDVGGFSMGKTNRPNEELFIRWTEFGFWIPITEIFCEPANPTSHLAWKYSSRADSVFRFYSRLKVQLFPYFYSAAHEIREKGIPAIRPVPGQFYEYLLGPSFLVAPVYEPGKSTRLVHFPEGTWSHFLTGETYTGGVPHLVPAPLGQIPVFVRKGAIIPMRPYSTSVEAGSADSVLLHLFPDSASSYTLYEDDGSSLDYQSGRIAKTGIQCRSSGTQTTVVIDPVSGTFQGMTAEKVWILVFHLPAEKYSVSSSLSPELIQVTRTEKGLPMVSLKASRLSRTAVTLTVEP